MTSRSTSLGKTTSAGINCAKGISFPSLEIIIFKGKGSLLVFRKNTVKSRPLWGGCNDSSSLLSGYLSALQSKSIKEPFLSQSS